MSKQSCTSAWRRDVACSSSHESLTHPSHTTVKYSKTQLSPERFQPSQVRALQSLQPPSNLQLLRLIFAVADARNGSIRQLRMLERQIEDVYDNRVNVQESGEVEEDHEHPD